MDKQPIRQLVDTFAKLNSSVAELGDDGDLYAAGLASLNTVNLMLAIEDEYDIEFDDDSLTKDTFRSVDALTSVVERLVANG